MIPYVLYVALLISVCLCFYKLLLKKETFYMLNRFVLLVIVVLSFIIPLVPVPQQWAFGRKTDEVITSTPLVKNNSPINDGSKTETTKQAVQQPENIQPAIKDATSANPFFSWSRVFAVALFLYWIGVLIFSINFLLQLFVLLHRALTKPLMKDGRFRIIELEGDKAPCSFASYIFINPSK